MKTAIRLALVAGTVCVAALPAAGRNFKLIKVGEPDATSIDALVASVTAGCTTDEQRAIAIWSYIAQRPSYHFWDCRDWPQLTTELGYVLDPITRFNVHGGVICFQVQHSMFAMAEKAGLAVRQKDLPGHCVGELFYNGAWHCFDAEVDCASYFRQWWGDDHIASVDEICANNTTRANYILNQQHKSDPYFQYDYLGGKFIPWGSKQYVHDNFYTVGAKGHYAGLRAWGHTIDFDLRRGEKLIRYWHRLGKWYCPKAYYDTHVGWFYDVTKGIHDLRNPKNHYVNGALIYQPDWAADANNFTDGLYGGVNYVRMDDGRVGPAGTGDCHVIFRVQVPYHIAGNPGVLGTDGDSYGGALLEADFHRADIAATNSVAISTDNGLTWNTLWTNSSTGDTHLKLDMTNQVEGRYGYLVKVTLLGDDVTQASISNMKLTTYLCMSPVPLPAMKPGSNQFTFSHTPQHAVFWIRPDLSDANWSRWFEQVHDLSYNAGSWTSRLTPSGSDPYAVAKVAPPAGWNIQKLSVVDAYSGGYNVEVLYSTAGPGGPWTSVFSGPHETGAHWRRERTVDITLPAPSPACWVKFRQFLNSYRIYAHCTRPEPALPSGSVKITHEWFAGGKLRSFSITPDLAGQTYTVPAKGAEVINRSLTIEVQNEPVLLKKSSSSKPKLLRLAAPQMP